MGQFMEVFNKRLLDSDELVETRGLTAPVHARRIQLQNGAPVVTDGLYAETHEALAGYWIIDCESFDRATGVRIPDAPPHVFSTQIWHSGASSAKFGSDLTGCLWQGV
jgi:hypothetical protein